MIDDPRQAKLLAAVLDDPDADEPRLVLSDSLMERQSPRGDLISLQVRLLQDALTRSMRSEYRARAAELLREHRARWVEPLGLPGAELRFRRGFVEAIDAEARPFFAAAEKIFGLEPVQVVALTGCPRGGLSKQAGASWLGRVRSLKVRGPKGVDEADLKVIASEFRSLRSLNLGESQISAEGAKLLARAPALRGLRVLALSGNELGDQGAAALADSVNLAGCEALYLARNEIGDEGVAALAASPYLGNLRRLGLDGNGEITDAGLRALVEAPALTHLGRLELQWCSVGNDTVKAARSRFGRVLP